MITCHRIFLEQRCNERGYTIDEVMPCVISQNGDEWTIDTDHPSYPRISKIVYVEPTTITFGPGTELKNLLSKIGIKSSPDCSCNFKAQQMNNFEYQEPGWCEKNIDIIIGWLKEESYKRGLPFIEIVAREIVKLAIRRAKKNIQ